MRKIGFACLSFFIFHAAANATPPIDAYGHLPSIELMQLAPSGQRYAFVAVVNESRKLIVLSDKGAAIYVVGIGDNKVRNLQWVGDDRLLLWTSSTFDNRLDLVQAHEFVSVINIDLKASKTSNVFDGTQQAAKIVFGSAGTAQINGHCYAYFVGIGYEWDRGAAASPSRGSYVFNGDHRNLYRVDLENGDVSMLARGGDGPGFEWVIGADGNVLAHSQYDADAGVWRLFAGTDRSKPLLERKSRFDDINLLGRGRTADTVWIADHSSNSLIEEVSIPDGKRETVFGDVRFDRYLTDPDSGLAIGAITNAESGASLFEPKLQARIKGTRKAFPDSRMQLISYSRNMDRLIVKTDAGDDSGTYWLVDIASGNANPLGYPYPEVRAADMGIAKWISYKAADGMDIEAVLTLPPARKAERLPLVVLPHGGPIGVNDDIGFDWWAQAYASAGYAVLQPNYRGSSGYGDAFEQAGFGQWGRKMQTDLSDGVSTLAAQGIIDPQRVCIVGASYGGYAALAGVTLQQGIYRCAVAVAGPSDMSAFFMWQLERHRRSGDATRYWRAVTGADKEGDATMRSISPAYFADKARSPILLIHGRDDTVVPIAQSQRMASALQHANKSVEFIEMKGEDHWLSRDETRKTMLKAAIEFVRKYNPPN